jgi:hypothetical protein
MQDKKITPIDESLIARISGRVRAAADAFFSAGAPLQ